MKVTELFERGEFVVSAEVGPPKGCHLEGLVEEAKEFLGGISAVNVTDCQSSVMRLGSLATCIKLKEAGLTPILCVGETLSQRDAGAETDVVRTQLKLALAGLDAAAMRKTVVAYEPVWAIGTGRTAAPAQAQDMCREIRAAIRESYDARTARAVTVQYGGSMNPANAAELLAQPDVDGGLIGGASLDPKKFYQIVEAAKI